MKHHRYTLSFLPLLLLLLSGCSPDPIAKQQDAPGAVGEQDATADTKPGNTGRPHEKKEVHEPPPLIPAPEPIPLSSQDLNDGWIRLFDGGSLFGWHAESDANWAIEDGAITVSEGTQGLLRTTSEFTDFKLRLEFKADQATNSGIFLRTAGQPTDPTKDCYEFNIAPADNPFPTGSLVGRRKIENAPTSGEWQTAEITVLGNQIKA